jgi:hypothetical protein
LVRITGTSDGGALSCEVAIYVTEPVLSAGDARKYFLVGSAPAPRGFASHSYLLFGEHLDPVAEPDRRAVVGAFLLRIEELSTRDGLGAPGTKNLLMIPVEQEPPPLVYDDPYSDRAIDWLLQNFNYERAQAILGAELASYGKGPYIVSYRDTPDGRQSLVQDMTNAHASAAEFWVDLHIVRSTQEDDWSDTSFELYGTRIVNALSVFAEALPVAIESVGNAASWLVRIVEISR